MSLGSDPTATVLMWKHLTFLALSLVSLRSKKLGDGHHTINDMTDQHLNLNDCNFLMNMVILGKVTTTNFN